jgi:hypothetical protein
MLQDPLTIHQLQMLYSNSTVLTEANLVPSCENAMPIIVPDKLLENAAGLEIPVLNSMMAGSQESVIPQRGKCKTGKRAIARSTPETAPMVLTHSTSETAPLNESVRGPTSADVISIVLIHESHEPTVPHNILVSLGR